MLYTYLFDLHLCRIYKPEMAIKKQYLKSKPVCKVTLTLASEAAKEAKKVNVVGDFNNWNKKTTAMDKLKNGTFKTIVDLEVGKKYQFRYLIDGEVWENDWAADEYVPNNLTFEENSVINLVQ